MVGDPFTTNPPGGIVLSKMPGIELVTVAVIEQVPLLGKVPDAFIVLVRLSVVIMTPGPQSIEEALPIIVKPLGRTSVNEFSVAPLAKFKVIVSVDVVLVLMMAGLKDLSSRGV